MPAWTFQRDRPSAFVAECYALLVAAWLSVTIFFRMPVAMLSDCVSAIGIYQGHFAGANDGVAVALRSFGTFGRELSPHPPRAAHVPGHRGHLGNEIADRLARSAALGRCCGCLQWSVDQQQPWWLGTGSPLGWAGVALSCLSATGVYPPPSTGGLPPCKQLSGLDPIQLVAPFLPPTALSDQGPARGNWGHFSLRVCSFNVLSLNSLALEGTAADGLAYQPARPTLLADSLRAAGVHVALLQETRTEEGFLRTQGYLRFASGAASGTLGVEVWLDEDHPLLTSPNGPGRLCLTLASCLVLHRDPRRLFVLLRQGRFRLLLCTLHAPHRAVEAGVIQAWWLETNRLLDVHAQSAVVLLGGDMNAAVGSTPNEEIGSHDADLQDVSGDFLAALLKAHQLWLPCTFSACHSGPSGTYVQKRNGAFSRIDFIACPKQWRTGQVTTWTEPAIHAGQAYVDHIATCSQIDLSLCVSGGQKPARRRRFDGRAMLTPEGRERVEGILQRAPNIPWEVSPHAHAAIVVRYLQDSLAEAFPTEHGRRYRDYLSDATWGLHREVAQLRRYCTRLKHAFRFHFLAAAFQAWRSADVGVLLRMLDSPWAKEVHRAGAAQSRQLAQVSGRLKAACKQDRAQHMSALADAVQRGSPDAGKAIQRLMGMKHKKPFHPEVLPSLCQANGDKCLTPEEVVLRWREHFRDQEDGVDTAPEALFRLVAASPTIPGPIGLDELPSPDALLQVIISAQKNKAAGPDGLPAEVGHASPQALVRLLMPLLFKMGVTCTEPIGFKGGTLTKLYKGRGETSQCASYRAIMLLPTLAKFLHKAFRPGLYQVFHSNAEPAQLGGLKRTSVVLGSHITRAFGRFCAAVGCSSVVLYADVASAYYTAVRALTARRPGTADPADAAKRSGRAHLLAELAKPSALTQAQASPWVEALTAELNSNTWMCLVDDDQPVVTRQGSRPGSSFADLFYGVTIPRMLRWRDEAREGCPRVLQGVEHAPTIWWDGRTDLTPPDEDPAAWTTCVQLSDVIWADDLAKCIVVHDAKLTAAAAALECGLLADAFYAHGYTLSFGPTKTAAMAVPRGPGSRQARRTLFGGKATLPVLREELGAACLPLVTSYRHLGVKVTSSTSMLAELKHRAAHAWSAFQQGRTKVFRSGRISLARRGALLATHVMTKLLFASGAWPALGRGEHAFFFRTVMSLYRQTLAVPPDGDQHLTHATICALLGQPPPEVLLLTERARYLLQLINAAPTQLWALIRRDPPYVAFVRDALQWVYRWVRHTSTLGDPDVAWPAWEQLLRQRPRVYKALIKRAKGLEVARTACIAALQAVRRLLEQLAGVSSPPAVAALRYQDACLQCKIAFPSRTAWACHASRVHAYRASSTMLVAGNVKPLCHACGKLYANLGRLKRHLSASSACRRGWGAFRPDPDSVGEVHPAAPPGRVSGDWEDLVGSLDPARVHPGLLGELRSLESPLSEIVWDAVVGYVEPLQMLRDTLAEWGRSPGAGQPSDEVLAVASDVALLLDPELWCEDFRAPKDPPVPAVACPPLPLLLDDVGRLPFVLSGAEYVLTLEAPPVRAFVHPFQASVPLAAARRQVAWLEASCDALGVALKHSQSSPVTIQLPPAALEGLAPVPTWFERSGFRVESGCLRSPRG